METLETADQQACVLADVEQDGIRNARCYGTGPVVANLDLSLIANFEGLGMSNEMACTRYQEGSSIVFKCRGDMETDVRETLGQLEPNGCWSTFDVTDGLLCANSGPGPADECAPVDCWGAPDHPVMTGLAEIADDLVGISSVPGARPTGVHLGVDFACVSYGNSEILCFGNETPSITDHPTGTGFTNLTTSPSGSLACALQLGTGPPADGADPTGTMVCWGEADGVTIELPDAPFLHLPPIELSMGQDENVPSTVPRATPSVPTTSTRLDRSAEEVRLTTQAEVALALELEHISRLGIPPDATVLDVGCGPGLLRAPLAGMVPQGRLVGIDADPKLLELARARAASKGRDNATFIEAWADNIPLADGHGDFTYARFLFQHLPHPVAVARELGRVTRSGGRVVLVDTDAPPSSSSPRWKVSMTSSGARRSVRPGWVETGWLPNCEASSTMPDSSTSTWSSPRSERDGRHASLHRHLSGLQVADRAARGDGSRGGPGHPAGRGGPADDPRAFAQTNVAIARVP